MWKKVVIEGKSFIIKISVDDDKNHEILLSDFSQVWAEILSEQEMLIRCKDLNPLCEAEPVTLIKMIKELIDPDKANVKKDLVEVGNQLTVAFSSYMVGVLFRFQFILILCTPEKFSHYLTFPLLQMIEELQAREKMLSDLLVKKDNEINEYKMEGVTITRKNIITEPFNKKKFLENCLSADAGKRSLTNLRCPYSFFEESCSKLYEDCSKRKEVLEEVLLPKKCQLQDTKEEISAKEKPDKNKRKKINELVFDDKEDEDDDDETNFPNDKAEAKPSSTVKIEMNHPEDETYFSNHNPQVKNTIKTEKKNSVALKKRKFLKNL